MIRCRFLGWVTAVFGGLYGGEWLEGTLSAHPVSPTVVVN